MPTYDYACTSCGNTWELEQRITENPAKKCPKCGKNTAKRQISSGGAFILKGGGWYADGYGAKKPSSSESKADDKGPKAESKSSSGEDGKKSGGETASSTSSKETGGGSGSSDPSPGDKKSTSSKDSKASAA
jgi:putative FmdB family regulatory protein